MTVPFAYRIFVFDVVAAFHLELFDLLKFSDK